MEAAPRSARGRRYKASSLQSGLIEKSRVASTKLLVSKHALEEGVSHPKLAMSVNIPNAAQEFQDVQMIE